MAPILFPSSLHNEVGLLVLFQLWFPVLIRLQILCCLLLPFLGILRFGHILQLSLLFREDDAEGGGIL